MDFTFTHPESREQKTLHLSEEQLVEMIDSDLILEKMVEEQCNCEPIGETNVVECGCEEYYYEFELDEQKEQPKKKIEINEYEVDLVVVTKEGQIKVGDKLKIIGKNTRDDQYAIAEDILMIGGNEEIIIDTDKNRYFITKLLIKGTSWAKQVCLVRE